MRVFVFIIIACYFLVLGCSHSIDKKHSKSLDCKNLIYSLTDFSNEIEECEEVVHFHEAEEFFANSGPYYLRWLSFKRKMNQETHIYKVKTKFEPKGGGVQGYALVNDKQRKLIDFMLIAIQ